MRALPIALAVVALLESSAHAAPAPRAPVIHETFTPLPCPAHPRSTIALECGGRALVKSDRAIDARVGRIFRLLPSRRARVSLVRSERAWLRYRSGSCEAETSRYAGGSAEPLLFLGCARQRNRSHLADLAESLRTLRPR